MRATDNSNAGDAALEIRTGQRSYGDHLRDSPVCTTLFVLTGILTADSSLLLLDVICAMSMEIGNDSQWQKSTLGRCGDQTAVICLMCVVWTTRQVSEAVHDSATLETFSYTHAECAPRRHDGLGDIQGPAAAA